MLQPTKNPIGKHPMRHYCHEAHLSLPNPDTEGTLYVWADPTISGPPPIYGTLCNLIPRALKAHAELAKSKIEIELTDCWLNFDQIQGLAADDRFSGIM